MVVRTLSESVGNVFAFSPGRWHCPQVSALPIGGEREVIRSRAPAVARCHRPRRSRAPARPSSESGREIEFRNMPGNSEARST